MFCKYCGKEMKDTATFCPACGNATGIAGQNQEQQNEYQQAYEEPGQQEGFGGKYRPPRRRSNVGIIHMGGSQTLDLYALLSMLASFAAIILTIVWLVQFSAGSFVFAIILSGCAIVFGTISKRFHGLSPMMRTGRIIGIVCLVVTLAYFVIGVWGFWYMYNNFPTLLL